MLGHYYYYYYYCRRALIKHNNTDINTTGQSLLKSTERFASTRLHNTILICATRLNLRVWRRFDSIVERPIWLTMCIKTFQICTEKWGGGGGDQYSRTFITWKKNYISAPYTILCIFHQQSWFVLFLFHKFSNFTPPSLKSWIVKLRSWGVHWRRQLNGRGGRGCAYWICIQIWNIVDLHCFVFFLGGGGEMVEIITFGIYPHVFSCST